MIQKKTGSKQEITTEKKQTEAGLAYEVLNRFINGMSVWLLKINILVSYEIMFVYGSLIVVLLVIDNIVNIGNLNWIDKFIAYNISYPIILLSYLVIRNREVLMEISLSMDNWWKYKFLETEIDGLKKYVETWMRKFSSAYFTVMIAGYIGYVLLPVGKYIYNGRKNTSDLLLYQCWSPFPSDTFWGLSILYIAEILALCFPFYIYIGIGTFLVTMMQLFSHQVQLVGIAFQTIIPRSQRIMEEEYQTDCKTYQNLLYVSVLQNEIRTCARHYQNIYRCLQKMCEIFAPTTNILYYSGLCILVYAGMQLVTKTDNPLMIIQAFFLIFAVIFTQYINSYVTESLADEVEKLKNLVYGSAWYDMPHECKKSVQLMHGMLFYSPKLTTFLGATCDKELFAKIINASYCYINTLITMKFNYEI